MRKWFWIHIIGNDYVRKRFWEVRSEKWEIDYERSDFEKCEKWESDYVRSEKAIMWEVILRRAFVESDFEIWRRWNWFFKILTYQNKSFSNLLKVVSSNNLLKKNSVNKIEK
jgi:hypothetical protein